MYVQHGMTLVFWPTVDIVALQSFQKMRLSDFSTFLALWTNALFVIIIILIFVLTKYTVW